jgi:hypothetical protein
MTPPFMAMMHPLDGLPPNGAVVTLTRWPG